MASKLRSYQINSMGHASSQIHHSRALASLGKPCRTAHCSCSCRTRQQQLPFAPASTCSRHLCRKLRRWALSLQLQRSVVCTLHAVQASCGMHAPVQQGLCLDGAVAMGCTTT